LANKTSYLNSEFQQPYVDMQNNKSSRSLSSATGSEAMQWDIHPSLGATRFLWRCLYLEAAGSVGEGTRIYYCFLHSSSKSSCRHHSRKACCL